MSQFPLISIIVPVFNTEKYVGMTIESVQNQTYSNWELLLIDDCSRDKSVEVCNSFAQLDTRIKVITLSQNSGALTARNEGIKNAKGRFICFLDSDDTYEPEKLKTQLEFMLEGNVPVSFTMFQRITEAGHFMGKSNVPFQEEVSYRQLLGNPAFSIITIMIDRDKVNVPIVEAKVVKAEDYVFHLWILKQGFKAKGINQPLSNYRFRQGSQSTSFLGNAADLWKVLTEIEKIPLPIAAFYFGKYLWKGVGKRLILLRQLSNSNSSS
ncbi:MAG TPA: glycosyltransferase family 2 protein, partial [Algoriphagus sp.]|nr:glycosyltransferase family 2 protein [Algoriphagus sp.]